MTDQQKSNLAKWLTALRSGKYRQCFGDRSYDGAYCAIGLACLVNNEDMFEGDIEDIVGLNWAGTRQILTMNDDNRLPFLAIADEIEKHQAEWFEAA
jgi:hypothetical protein